MRTIRAGTSFSNEFPIRLKLTFHFMVTIFKGTMTNDVNESSSSFATAPEAPAMAAPPPPVGRCKATRTRTMDGQTDGPTVSLHSDTSLVAVVIVITK